MGKVKIYAIVGSRVMQEDTDISTIYEVKEVYKGVNVINITSSDSLLEPLIYSSMQFKGESALKGNLGVVNLLYSYVKAFQKDYDEKVDVLDKLYDTKVFASSGEDDLALSIAVLVLLYRQGMLRHEFNPISWGNWCDLYLKI